MVAPIRLGDPTSHGGVVETAQSQTNLMGKALACVGDKCSCPLPGHNNCVIAEGDGNWLINGKPVALDGHKTSCGAILSATIGNATRAP
jgi:uncharacterized Zn-binding protein involved in type VI secretion